MELSFTKDELALLEAAADKAGYDSYEYRRWDFARDWAEGNRWNTPSTHRWARKIKEELKKMVGRR